MPDRQWWRVQDSTGLSRALIAARHEAGLTQQELADWLGSDRTTVVRLESGQLEIVRRLTEALSLLGLDLLLVPRGAAVTVTTAGGADAPDGR